MDINVTKNFENKLLNRKEVEFTLTYDSSTPSRKKIIEKLAGLINEKKELIILQSLENKFGSKSAYGKAMVYDNKEAMKDIERKHFIKRSQKEEPKKEKKE